MNNRKITFSLNQDVFQGAQDAKGILGVYVPPMYKLCMDLETEEIVRVSYADLERFSDRFMPLSQEAIEQVECSLRSELMHSRFIPSLHDQQEKEMRERFYGKTTITAQITPEEIRRQAELLNLWERRHEQNRLVKRQDEVPEGSRTVQMILD